MHTLQNIIARLNAICKRAKTSVVNFAKLMQFYKSINEAPAYPKNFKMHSKSKNKVKNKEVLLGLREKEQGDWKKIYLDGYLNGKKVSIHFFQSKSGLVFDVKVKDGWSNKGNFGGKK